MLRERERGRENDHYSGTLTTIGWLTFLLLSALGMIRLTTIIMQLLCKGYTGKLH